MDRKGLRFFFPIKVHEELKRATDLRIPLKSLLAILYVARWHCFTYIKIKIFKKKNKNIAYDI